MVKLSSWAVQAALITVNLTSLTMKPALAMPPNPEEYEIEQADGSFIKAKLVGSEDDPGEEDDEGFVIIGAGKSGNEYEYAVLDDETGDLKPSGVKATDRAHRPAGLRKRLRRSGRAKQNMGLGGSGPISRRPGGAGMGSRGRGIGAGGQTSLGGITGRFGSRAGGRRELIRMAHVDMYEQWDEEVEDFHRRTMDWTGTKKNLVIPMRFAGHESRWLPTTAQLNILFNNNGPDPTYAPTGSVRDVFKASSYGQLDMISDVVDWIPLSKTESYYANGARGYTTVMHEAMREALNYLEKTKKLDFSQYDTDKDGLIDSICFLHSGYAAEWGGNAEDGANYLDRIWSHKWSLYSFREPSTSTQPGWTSTAYNVRVYNYHISPAVYGTWPSSKPVKEKMGRIGVIAHETGHFLGITDLYDKAGDGGSGIGSWGLMANSWGFNNDQWCIPIFSPWSKIQLGWLTPQEITTSGTMSITPSYSTKDVKIIKKGYPTNEYLLIEYRKAMGFESCLPAEGLAIWHIDDNHDYDNQGWPGMPGWPANDKHYRISVLAADGNYDLEQNRNRGDGNDLWRAGYKDYLGPGTASGTTVYPNTDSYQSGNIKETGIVISKISASGGSQMTFQVTIPGSVSNTNTNTPPVSSPVKAPSTPITSTTQVCTSSQRKLIISIKTDNFGSDTTWQVIDVYTGKGRIQSGGPYPDGISKSYISEYCLPARSCYKFVIRDKSADGIQGAGNGWSVSWAGELLYATKANPSFSSDGVSFGGSCLPDASLSSVDTGLNGSAVHYGNMFDIKAKNDIIIRRFASIHTSKTNTYKYKVYTKCGSYIGYEKDPSSWTLVQDQTITGKGFGSATTVSNVNFFQHVAVLGLTTQAFYVVLDQPEIVFLYDATLKEGSAYNTFPDLSVGVGTYNMLNFGFAGRPAAWNGKIAYASARVATAGMISGGLAVDISVPEVNFPDDELSEEDPEPLDSEIASAVAHASLEIQANGGVPLPVEQLIDSAGQAVQGNMEDTISMTFDGSAPSGLESVGAFSDQEEVQEEKYEMEEEEYVMEQEEEDYYTETQDDSSSFDLNITDANITDANITDAIKFTYYGVYYGGNEDTIMDLNMTQGARGRHVRRRI